MYMLVWVWMRFIILCSFPSFSAHRIKSLIFTVSSNILTVFCIYLSNKAIWFSGFPIGHLFLPRITGHALCCVTVICGYVGLLLLWNPRGTQQDAFTLLIGVQMEWTSPDSGLDEFDGDQVNESSVWPLPHACWLWASGRLLLVTLKKVFSSRMKHFDVNGRVMVLLGSLIVF